MNEFIGAIQRVFHLCKVEKYGLKRAFSFRGNVYNFSSKFNQFGKGCGYRIIACSSDFLHTKVTTDLGSMRATIPDFLPTEASA